MRNPKGLFFNLVLNIILVISFMIIPAGLLWAGEKLQKYSDAKNKLSFSYPATWKQMTPSEARQVMGADNVSKWVTLVLYDPNDRSQNINVQVLSPVGAKDITEAAYKKFAKRMDSDISGSARKISSKVGRLSGMAFLEYIMEQTRPDGVSLRQKQFRTGKEGREIVITFTSKTDLWASYDKECFQVIVSTLRMSADDTSLNTSTPTAKFRISGTIRKGDGMPARGKVQLAEVETDGEMIHKIMRFNNALQQWNDKNVVDTNSEGYFVIEVDRRFFDKPDAKYSLFFFPLWAGMYDHKLGDMLSWAGGEVMFMINPSDPDLDLGVISATLKSP